MSNSLITSSLTGNSSNTTKAVSASADVSETKDMFTKLLVAQIQNQDPLEPSDPSEFINQLSQLSQTEAMQSLTNTTSASATVLQSLQVLAMGSQVGSQVTVQTDRVRFDGNTIEGSLNLGSASSATNLVLTGVDGVAHTLSLPYHAAGVQSFTLDPAALGLNPGTYSISAQAAGSAVPVEITARVNSVKLSSAGAIVMNIAGVGEVDPSAITGFNGTTPLAAN